MVWVFFTGSLVIQLGIILSMTRLFSTSAPLNKKTRTSRISVVIAARNEASNLQKLLPALLSQTHSNFEIIISLDRCTDHSEQVLLSFQDARIHYHKIDKVPASWNEKKYALNQAIKNAKGDWLVFTDADCLPSSSSWLSSLQNQFDNHNIVIGYSPYVSEGGLLQNYIQYEAFVTGFLYLSSALLKEPYMAVGRNLAIRKNYFNRVGGYQPIHSIKGGDDDLFIQRNARSENTTVCIGKDAIVWTFPKQSWSEYFQQKKRHLSVSIYYKSFHKIFLSFFHITALSVWVLLPFTKPVGLGLLFFSIYIFIKNASFRFVSKRTGSGFNFYLLPVVDMVYAFLIPVLGIVARTSKNIKWKN